MFPVSLPKLARTVLCSQMACYLEKRCQACAWELEAENSGRCGKEQCITSRGRAFAGAAASFARLLALGVNEKIGKNPCTRVVHVFNFNQLPLKRKKV